MCCIESRIETKEAASNYKTANETLLHRSAFWTVYFYARAYLAMNFSLSSRFNGSVDEIVASKNGNNQTKFKCFNMNNASNAVVSFSSPLVVCLTRPIVCNNVLHFELIRLVACCRVLPLRFSSFSLFLSPRAFQVFFSYSVPKKREKNSLQSNYYNLF